MTNNDELLRRLRGIWEIESNASHVSGYWIKDDDLVDLADLQISEDSAQENQHYLDPNPRDTIIRIKGDES